VTCGITFTFGGVRIDHETGQVLDLGYQPIPGLYAAGEMVGGIFYFNYPAGTGLVSGTVFGRIAGNGGRRRCACGVSASAALLAPRIAQGNRAIENRRAGLRVRAVGDEVAMPLELKAFFRFGVGERRVRAGR